MTVISHIPAQRERGIAWLLAWPRVALTLLCLLMWLPGFFTLPPGDRDESRFAQATHQMLETGDFVRILNGTEARNRKPIGIHWLQLPFVAAAEALGLAQENPIWPYRIPSALGGLLAVLMTFEAGQTLFDRRTGALAAAMLAACVALTVEVHIAKTDAALLGVTTAAMAALARAYVGEIGARGAAVFWLAIGAGILLKGPITPMVAGLTAGALCIADRRVGWLRGLRAGWGVPLMLAVVLPWFVAIGVATHGRFFAEAVGGDLARKLSSGDDAHGGWPGLHLLLAPVLLFPASAALPGAALFAWRARASPSVRFVLAWVGPAWIVFEAAPTKLPHYTLPLYPALCLLAACGVGVVWTRAVRWGGAGLAGVAAAGFAVAAAGGPMLLGGAPFIPGLVAASVVGIVAVRRVALAPLVAPLLYAAVLGIELPRLSALWLAPRIVAALPPGTALGSVGFSEPSLMFLAGTGTQWLRAADGARALADGTVGALVVGDRDMGPFESAAAALGMTPRVMAVVPGFNISRGRFVVLTLLER